MCQPVEILLHKNGQNVFYQLQEIQGDITDVLCLVNLVIKINELNIYPFVCVFEEVFVFWKYNSLRIKFHLDEFKENQESLWP